MWENILCNKEVRGRKYATCSVFTIHLLGVRAGFALGLRRVCTGAPVKCAGSALGRRQVCAGAPGPCAGSALVKKPGADDPEHGVGEAKIGRSSVQTLKKSVQKTFPKFIRRHYMI